MCVHVLALMLGVSRPSVNKELHELAARGWLKLGRGYVTLLDMVAPLDLP
jgi:Mn-dependent DtxR family transcriptional regulator